LGGGQWTVIVHVSRQKKGVSTVPLSKSHFCYENVMLREELLTCETPFFIGSHRWNDRPVCLYIWTWKKTVSITTVPEYKKKKICIQNVVIWIFYSYFLRHGEVPYLQGNGLQPPLFYNDDDDTLNFVPTVIGTVFRPAWFFKEMVYGHHF